MALFGGWSRGRWWWLAAAAAAAWGDPCTAAGVAIAVAASQHSAHRCISSGDMPGGSLCWDLCGSGL